MKEDKNDDHILLRKKFEKMEEEEKVADYLLKDHPYCIFNMNQDSDQAQNQEKTTLIVGVGPSWLAAAKYALQTEIKPIIL